MARDRLINTGILAVRPRTAHQQRTVVVLGPDRGGTSMPAGVLHHLGVYMGDNLGVNYEDIAFSKLVENDEIDLLRAVRNDRDHAHPVWGWKRPSAIGYLDLIERELTNPYYILVFRDVFAIANRRLISMEGRSDLVQCMNNALVAYRRMIDVVHTSSRPCLLLSYDKCLYRPLEMVQAMVNFLGLNSVNINDAVAFVRRDPDDYLKKSRLLPPDSVRLRLRGAVRRALRS